MSMIKIKGSFNVNFEMSEDIGFEISELKEGTYESAKAEYIRLLQEEIPKLLDCEATVELTSFEWENKAYEANS